MGKYGYVAILLSLGLGVSTPHLSLFAIQIPPSTSESKQDQQQMAAWLLESGQVAKAYVEEIDKGQYSQSWSKSDQMMQGIIPQQEWSEFLSNSRKRLGRVKSRILKVQRPAWNPHGLPEGAYMVVDYNTSFENAPALEEIMTLHRGADGKWRVLTYNYKNPD